MMSSGWAVVSCRCGIEEIAERQLREAGYRVYLPRVRRVLRGHRRPGRGEAVLRPMLAGYLFAWLDEGQSLSPGPSDRWRHWHFNRERAFVSDAAVELLRSYEREEGDAAIAAARAREARSAIGTQVDADLWDLRVSGVVRELRGADRLIIETISGRRVEITEASVVRA